MTQPGAFHTAGSAHLEGIDFAGKTGTAQVMSHEALDKTAKGQVTNPNVWFVGVTPRRNPELVVAVLWQNGDISYYPARIGAKSRLGLRGKAAPPGEQSAAIKDAGAAAPVEVGAVWTTPDADATQRTLPACQPARLHAGHFFVNPSAPSTARSRRAASPQSRIEAASASLGFGDLPTRTDPSSP